jgi:hypothetical protein
MNYAKCEAIAISGSGTGHNGSRVSQCVSTSMPNIMVLPPCTVLEYLVVVIGNERHSISNVILHVVGETCSQYSIETGFTTWYYYHCSTVLSHSRSVCPTYRTDRLVQLLY